MDETLRETLTAHAGRYPAMEPRDAVKLIYQNEFGGGHLIADPAGSLARLRAEYADAPRDPGAPLAEDIGNGMVRVHLGGLDRLEYPLEALNRDFARSAALHRGGMDLGLGQGAVRRRRAVGRHGQGRGLFLGVLYHVRH